MSWLSRATLGLALAGGVSGAALACAPQHPCAAPPVAYPGGPAGHYSAYGADRSYQAYRREQAYAHSQTQSYAYAQAYGAPVHVFGPEVYGPPPGVAYGHPGYGYAAPCCVPCQNACGGTPGLVLPSGFFADGGGVGPIPAGGYGGGGGFVIVGGGAAAGASASAYASAQARASTQVTIGGGYRGGHGHGGGHGKGGHGGHGGKGR